MADEVATTAPAEAPAVSQNATPNVAASSLTSSQPSTDPVTTSEPMEVDGGSSIPKEDEETAGKQATTEVTAPNGDTTEVAEAPSSDAVAAPVEGTPAGSNKNGKRKSTGGVPEHKNKKLNKKKSMVTLRLDCKPGEHYWARLKGYPPWPAVICDEQMLPESLLGTRPVSTARPDGSLRDDFKEGGKNAKERTFPIMFLSTNEFSWMVNTALTPLDPEECKQKPTAKMTKALQDAYRLASESHDLAYYKGLLATWQKEEQQIQEEIAEWEAKEAKAAEERRAAEALEAGNEDGETKEKKPKKARKSKVADEDIEMEDGAEPPKSSKKRKKDAESDAEGVKPKKTPKVTKLNAPKTPNGEAAASTKKSTSKPKKKVSAPTKEEEEETKPQMTEAEKLAQREKAVLYLRHRLQKGFLSRDQAPQESEMANMADFFSQLEAYKNLEPSIIRTTKIHKVLKAIVKLAAIPREEQFDFKKRSAEMLEIWNKRMEADGDAAPAAASEAKSAPAEKSEQTVPVADATNGEAKIEPAAPETEVKEGAKEEVSEEKGAEAADEIEKKVGEPAAPAVEPPEAPVEKVDGDKVGNDAKDEAEVGDVSMQTAPEEPAPAAETAA